MAARPATRMTRPSGPERELEDLRFVIRTRNGDTQATR